MTELLCALSVDLDEIPNYLAIHGMRGSLSARAEHAVYDVAVPRLVEVAAALGVPLTLFAVGEDLDRPAAAKALHDAVAAGHGVANHTRSHRYDLTRLSSDAIAREIDDGTLSIERATGVRPRGFRAPGYTITDEVFSLLPGLGYRWDSSVFPCPAYMAAKDTAIGLYKLRGTPSRSIIDTPSMLLAPSQPYRIGAPYWKRGAGLLELPIGVTRGLRLPFIGTSLMLAGPTGARVLTRMMIGLPFVNLELHGIDLLDSRDADLSTLAQHQRDLRITQEKKRATLSVVVETLRAAGYSFVTLDAAADREPHPPWPPSPSSEAGT